METDTAPETARLGQSRRTATARFTTVTVLWALWLCLGPALPALGGSPANEPRAPSSSEAVRAKIARTVDAYLARRPKIAGRVVGALRPGPDGAVEEIALFRGNGRAGGPPPDRHTRFEIGSVAKTFTAAMLADFARKGLVDPAAPAQAFYNDMIPGQVRLPVFPGSPGLTLMELAVHASGLPRDPGNLPKAGCRYSRRAMRAYLASLKSLPGPPGAAYAYSNLGYGVLADVLALVCRAPDYQTMLTGFLAEAKLSLPDTGVVSGDGKDELAAGHGPNGARASDCLKSWPALDGAGAMYASLDDMLTWLRFNLGLTASPKNDLLPALHKPRMETDFGAAGLGWQMRRLVSYPEEAMIFKNGGTKGFRCHLSFLAGEKAGVVVLSNTNIANDALGARIMEILIDSDYIDWNP